MALWPSRVLHVVFRGWLSPRSSGISCLPCAKQSTKWSSAGGPGLWEHNAFLRMAKTAVLWIDSLHWFLPGAQQLKSHHRKVYCVHFTGIRSGFLCSSGCSAKKIFAFLCVVSSGMNLLMNLNLLLAVVWTYCNIYDIYLMLFAFKFVFVLA